ncbi:hypothetical protein PR048_005095 [Dryococelus australis]|uniref:Uncharacterized protein n=1 Tax=Dryococelus australis TaxID=614101 RepID=A0ABQ9I787_9NEOP|nr:hypothetical protein PR048_005095 [Dryococelus australis]
MKYTTVETTNHTLRWFGPCLVRLALPHRYQLLGDFPAEREAANQSSCLCQPPKVKDYLGMLHTAMSARRNATLSIFMNDYDEQTTRDLTLSGGLYHTRFLRSRDFSASCSPNSSDRLRCPRVRYPPAKMKKKRAEQWRSGTSKTSVDVKFYENMLATVQQENFLANENNKIKLIELLVETLTAREIEVSTATGDTDGSITRCGLNKVTSHSSVVVIVDDVDLLPGRGNIEDKVYSSRQLQELPFSGSILFIHSFIGCDTACAIFNKKKLSILKCFLKMPNETKAIADIFYYPSSTPDVVAQAGEETFLTMYQAPPSKRYLNNYRYNSFMKSFTKLKANLTSLPPTKGTAKQHSVRVYLQTQQWLDNDSLNPARWGWVRDDSGVLDPVKTTYPMAPNSVLI